MPEIGEDTARIVQVITALITVAIAAVAFGISIRTERRAIRAEQRAERVITANEKSTAATVRPMLAIERSGYVDHKEVRLVNHGPGVALNVSVQITKDRKSYDRLVDVFDVQRFPSWDTYYWFMPGQEYVPAEGERSLVRLTAEHLGGGEAALASLREWETALGGTTIRVTYEDVFGTKMRPCERVFKRERDQPHAAQLPQSEILVEGPEA